MTAQPHTTGPIHRPGEPAYDDERTGYQRLVNHRPALVVAAASAEDVRAAVTFAAARGERVAVQAGGHGVNRPLTGGVLISTRRMAGVRVDPRSRTARVEAGATWQHVIDAAAEHGLAPLSGSAPGVGAVPYTLGGGVGLLGRRYGFAADHVHRLDLVTADGRSLRVTPEHEPDLFWALRGGGGNFGVVTAMEIELVPVSHVYGGSLYFDLARVPEVPDAWRRWTATVPDELTSAVSMLPFPDLPMVPKALRGRHVAQVQVCYAGPADAGERLVRPLRELGPVLRDTLRLLPFTESGSVFDEPDTPHAYRSDGRLLRTLDPQALESLVKLAGPSAPVMCVAGLRHLGGAFARQPRHANAIGHRDAAYAVSVLSPVGDGSAGSAGSAAEDRVRAVHADAIAPFARHAIGRMLNFSFGALDEDGVRSAYRPEDYHRLTALRDRYDPDRMFLPNHPIGEEVG
ncbi:FAD-binding oxidoreductase [Prauserella oleivorans]|uniref:FAD-binding oxidoreductase n=1 Tax=Prauserella oleivorans TaxID=1478153 RepID=A0ABW5WEE4_9PSEU